jgi:hypothetical protein
LSSGRALTRIVVIVAAALALVWAGCSLWPSREKRLWAFVDSCRDALLEGREEDFVACFDPGVRYQSDLGLAEIRRDYRRYRGIGVPEPTIIGNEVSFDDAGADLRLDVVLSAGLRPLGRYAVRLRAREDADRSWRIETVRWE